MKNKIFSGDSISCPRGMICNNLQTVVGFPRGLAFLRPHNAGRRRRKSTNKYVGLNCLRNTAV